MQREDSSRQLYSVGGTPQTIVINRLTAGYTSLHNPATGQVSPISDQSALIGVYAALSDQDPRVRQAAIMRLQVLERERSVSWLLVALQDADAEVRCAAAKTFEHFFREEEAVVYRKYLSIPLLLQRLNDPQAKVRICAVRALAEAERYRAVIPLTRLLQDQDHGVRTNAVRALGMIRDRNAIVALIEVLQSSKQSAMVKAYALIALKKLGQGMEQHIKRLQQGLPVIDHLLHGMEGSVVFNRERLLAYRNQLTGALKAP